jgi:ribonuclease P protein component
MQTMENTQATNQERTPREAGNFTRRIGSTTYRVGVHFSKTSKENVNDKIARLIRSDTRQEEARPWTA